MAKKIVSVDVNLVPKDPFFNTYLGKSLKWALSVGRYIVIFTELIVILSFVTRFTLDRQITDLNDSLFQKQTVVESFGTLENDVNQMQAVIEQYRQIEQQTNIANTFPHLSLITPRGVTMETINLKADSVTISGYAESQDSLNTLINNIQLSNKFVNVEVSKIATAEKRPGFEFSLKADIVKQES